MSHIDDLVLGKSPEAVPLENCDSHRLAALSLAQQARRALSIHTPDLDRDVYDQQPFLDAVIKLATHGRQALIRILLRDPMRALTEGHRLIELSQRLPTFVQIRIPSEAYRDYNQAFLVADEMGLLHRPVADRYEGKACFYAPLEASNLLRYFDQAWEHATPDPRLRRLSL